MSAHCVDCEWCDFVVKAGKDTHTQRIYRDREWWKLEMVKLKQFYFNSLLPELASPRFKKGGIREPDSQLHLLISSFFSFHFFFHACLNISYSFHGNTNTCSTVHVILQNSIYMNFIYCLLLA